MAAHDAWALVCRLFAGGTRVLQEPALLDRVRVAGGDIRVITPRPRTTRGSPFGPGVEWLHSTTAGSRSSARRRRPRRHRPPIRPRRCTGRFRQTSSGRRCRTSVAHRSDSPTVRPKCSRRCGRSRAKPQRRNGSCGARTWTAPSRAICSRSRRKTRASQNLRRSTRPTARSWSRSDVQGCIQCHVQQVHRRDPPDIKKGDLYGISPIPDAPRLALTSRACTFFISWSI